MWVICVCFVCTTDMVINVTFGSCRHEIVRIENIKSVPLSGSHSHIVGMGCVPVVMCQYAPFSALRLVGAIVL